MNMIFFTFREYMLARKASVMLKNVGIQAKLARTPAVLAVNGCGYGLWVKPSQLVSAVEELGRVGIRYEKIHGYDGRTYREMNL